MYTNVKKSICYLQSPESEDEVRAFQIKWLKEVTTQKPLLEELQKNTLHYEKGIKPRKDWGTRGNSEQNSQ